MKPHLAFVPILAAIAIPVHAAAHRPGTPESGNPTPGTLEVRQPWSRPAVAGTNGIGYMVIVNTGRIADALVRVDSPAAAGVELHSSAMTGGVMSMTRRDKAPIPPGQTRFGPGAYHLMFLRLTRTLKPGDPLPATLTFASGLRLKVNFRVSVNAPGGPMADGPTADMPAMADMPGMKH